MVEERTFTEEQWTKKTAVDLFNHTWTLIEKSERTQAEDDEMLHAAHASRHLWSKVGAAVNLARGEWQVSRVYSVLKRSEPALYHASRCLAICQENGIGDFDIAYAYEVMARAYLIAGSREEAMRYKQLAAEAGARIADAEDRELLENDLKTIE